MEEKKTYVGEGPKFMGFFAQRHLYFDVNKDIAKKYNEYYKSDLNTSIGFLIVGILFLGGGAWLFLGGGLWKIIIATILAILGIASTFMAYIGIVRDGTPTASLKRGILNPGIIAKIDTDGIGILVLAETSNGWGLRSVRLKDLPPVHEKRIGERVPVTCAMNASTAYPIAWGTDSKEVIDVAIKGITPVEWNALERLIDRYDYQPEYSADEMIRYLSKEDQDELMLDIGFIENISMGLVVEINGETAKTIILNSALHICCHTFNLSEFHETIKIGNLIPIIYVHETKEFRPIIALQKLLEETMKSSDNYKFLCAALEKIENSEHFRTKYGNCESFEPLSVEEIAVLSLYQYSTKERFM